MGGWLTPQRASRREGDLVGESQCCAAHLPPHPTHRYFPRFSLGWYSEIEINPFLVQEKEFGPMFEDSQGAQKSQYDPVLSLGLSLGAKDAVSLYQGSCQPV